MTDYTKPFPCGECDKMVMATEKHTFEDCKKWKEHLKKQTENSLEEKEE